MDAIEPQPGEVWEWYGDEHLGTFTVLDFDGVDVTYRYDVLHGDTYSLPVEHLTVRGRKVADK